LALSDLLATLRLNHQAPKDVVVLGLVPYHLENKLHLSPESIAKLNEIIGMILSELKRHNIELQLREEPLPGFWEVRAEMEERQCA